MRRRAFWPNAERLEQRRIEVLEDIALREQRLDLELEEKIVCVLEHVETFDAAPAEIDARMYCPALAARVRFGLPASDGAEMKENSPMKKVLWAMALLAFIACAASALTANANATINTSALDLDLDDSPEVLVTVDEAAVVIQPARAPVEADTALDLLIDVHADTVERDRQPAIWRHRQQHRLPVQTTQVLLKERRSYRRGEASTPLLC